MSLVGKTSRAGEISQAQEDNYHMPSLLCRLYVYKDKETKGKLFGKRKVTRGMEGGFKRGQLEYNRGTLYVCMKTSK